MKYKEKYYEAKKLLRKTKWATSWIVAAMLFGCSQSNLPEHTVAENASLAPKDGRKFIFT